MPGLCELGIAEASRQIRAKKLSVVDLVQAHLQRIGDIDGGLSTYITVTADAALRAAQEAASEVAKGEWRGPLHGIPISYKDLIATRGIRTTAASRVYADWVPAEDAYVVSKLRRAGCITLGKATLNEFAFSAVSENDYVKPARNPWNPRYSPGLSSSGSAAGVAAGLAMASIATDSGGSIRIPASYCGVTGLKPTFGRIGRTGVLPLSYSLDHVGILARSAEDVALILKAAAGFDKNDPGSAADGLARFEASLARSSRGLRIGICPTYMESVGVDPAVGRAFDAAIGVFRRSGATVREIPFAHFPHAVAANFTMIRVEGFAAHFPNLRDRQQLYGNSAFMQIAVGGFLSARDYLRAQQARGLISSELAALFERIDILALPSTSAAASGGSGRHGSNLAFVAPFNLTGNPALSIPCGFDDAGMPIGLELVGRAFEESALLGAAHMFQQGTDWHLRHPQR